MRIRVLRRIGELILKMFDLIGGFSLMCITAMDTAEVDLPESTGVELDFLQPKKKRKKKGSKSNGLQIQGYMA